MRGKYIIYIIMSVILLFNVTSENMIINFTFDNYDNLTTWSNINITNGVLSIPKTKLNYSSLNQRFNYTCDNSTVFYVNFEGNTTDANCSVGSATPLRAGNYTYVNASTGFGYGTALRLHNFSNGIDGYIKWASNTNFDHATMLNYSVEFVYKCPAMSECLGNFDSIFKIHSNMDYLSYENIHRVYGVQSDLEYMYTWNDNLTANQTAYVSFERRQTADVSECFLYYNNILVDTLKNCKINDDFNLGIMLGGEWNSVENTDVIIDQIRISNVTRHYHNQENQTGLTIYENYSVFPSFIETQVFDSGNETPILNVSADINYNNNDGNASEQTAVVISTLWCTDMTGYNCTPEIWEPSVSLSFDGCYENVTIRGLEVFNNYSYTGTCTIDNAADNFTAAAILNSSGWDIGVEDDASPISEVLNNYYLWLVNRSFNRYTIRPYQNTINYEAIREWEKYYKIIHNVRGTGFSYGTPVRNYQCQSGTGDTSNFDAVCAKGEADDAVTYKRWSVITTHNIQGTKNLTNFFAYINSSNVYYDNVYNVYKRYYKDTFPTIINYTNLTGQYQSRRYFKLRIHLKSAGNNTPLVDNLTLTVLNGGSTTTTTTTTTTTAVTTTTLSESCQSLQNNFENNFYQIAIALSLLIIGFIGFSIYNKMQGYKDTYNVKLLVTLTTVVAVIMVMVIAYSVVVLKMISGGC